MSLKHALLGFLNYQSMTGYHLKKYFDESIANFWNASLSQIYPTLNQMSEQGLLRAEVVQQDMSPNAKVYHITDKGKKELLNWLNEPFEREVLRSSLLVKVYFSSNISKEQVIIQLRELIALSRKKMDVYMNGKKHIEEKHSANGDMSKDAFFWSLAADYGIKNEEFFISWCEECIEKLR